MEKKRRYYMPTVVHGENDTNETLSKEAWEGGRGANLNFAEDGCNDWQGSNEGNKHVCARDRRSTKHTEAKT